jgi:hypothetical protein
VTPGHIIDELESLTRLAQTLAIATADDAPARCSAAAVGLAVRLKTLADGGRFA